MDREWWEYGEEHLVKVYDTFIRWLKSSGYGMEWADDPDPAVLCDVFESHWGGHFGIAASANDLRFDMDPQDWFDIADYLNHWDPSDMSVEFKMFDWMCKRYKREHTMTWRDLMVRIGELPENELDEPAMVWIAEDEFIYDGGHPIVGLSRYDADGQDGTDNQASLDIGY